MKNEDYRHMGKVFFSKKQLAVDLDTMKTVRTFHDNVTFEVTKEALIVIYDDLNKSIKYPWANIGEKSIIEWHLGDNVFTRTDKEKGINISFLIMGHATLK